MATSSSRRKRGGDNIKKERHAQVSETADRLRVLMPEHRTYGGTELARAGRKRRKRYGKKEKRGRVKSQVGIEKRPKVGESRSRIADGEGDAMEGGKGSSGWATFVEGKMQLPAVSVLKGGSAKELNHAARRGFDPHPGVPVKTVTVDNGRERVCGTRSIVKIIGA